MKRNWTLIRELCFAMEENRLASYLHWPPKDGGGKEEHHLSLMQQGGLCDGIRLTMEGHDFLDMARSPEAWDEVCAKIKEYGGLPFDTVKAILECHSAKTGAQSNYGLKPRAE